MRFELVSIADLENNAFDTFIELKNMFVDVGRIHNVTIDGNTYRVIINWFNRAGSDTLHIFIEDDDCEILCGEIELSYDLNYIVASTTIQKYMPHLLPKLGRELYKKMLQYMTYLTEVYGKPILHIVEMNNEYGLGTERWREIFEPILIRRGYIEYVKSGTFYWRKMYQTAKK